MWSFLLPIGTLAVSTISLLFILLALAPEAGQGFVQKIFFFHVPSAFAMYACLLVSGLASGLFLAQRKKSMDALARASMSGAVLFGIIVMISGPIWAKPIWGVYWTWDPRLTTTFVVFVLMIAYFFTRKIFDDRQQSERGALVGSILAIIAVLDIPLIHFSVKLWRGVHPSVLRNADGLPPDYRLGLELMTLSFLLIAGLFVWTLFKVMKAEETLNA